MKYSYISLLLSGMMILLAACQDNSRKLPILGERTLLDKVVDGKKVIDTIYHRIPKFSFLNQEGKNITEKTIEGKVYIADVFFTSCPTICPTVKAQMKRIYDQYRHREDFLMLSHTIDPKRDTVGRLAWYAKKMNIEADRWHLLTGKSKSLFRIATAYLLAAAESPDAPGGFDHSGSIVLIDRNRHIRGAYDGTDPKMIDQLIKDIAILLREKPVKMVETGEENPDEEEVKTSKSKKKKLKEESGAMD